MRKSTTASRLSTIAREERRNSLDRVALRMLEEALASARAFAAEFTAKVDRDTVDVARRILNDSTALPPTAATLVNLLAERSNALTTRRAGAVHLSISA